MSDTCVSDDQLKPVASQGAYGLEVLDQDFKGKIHEVADCVVTGRDIIRLARKRPAKNFIVLRQLASGQMEEVGLDEKHSLSQESKDRYFVIKGDRTYRFMVDGYRLAWPQEALTGDQIRRLALKDVDFEVWQECTDVPDKLVSAENSVSLSGKGVESFVTKPKTKLVEVTYNEDIVLLEKRSYSFQELFQVFGVIAGYVLEQIKPNGEFDPLEPGDTIKIKKGLAFFSHAPVGQSS